MPFLQVRPTRLYEGSVPLGLARNPVRGSNGAKACRVEIHSNLRKLSSVKRLRRNAYLPDELWTRATSSGLGMDGAVPGLVTETLAAAQA